MPVAVLDDEAAATVARFTSPKPRPPGAIRASRARRPCQHRAKQDRRAPADDAEGREPDPARVGEAASCTMPGFPFQLTRPWKGFIDPKQTRRHPVNDHCQRSSQPSARTPVAITTAWGHATTRLTPAGRRPHHSARQPSQPSDRASKKRGPPMKKGKVTQPVLAGGSRPQSSQNDHHDLSA